MSRSSKILMVLLILGSLGGCSSLRELLGFGYVEPEISLKAIEVKKFTLTAIKMNVTLEVENPNSFDLTLYKLDYKIAAMGMEIAKGLYDKEFSVASQKRGLITVPLDIDAKSAVKLIKGIMDDPEQEYMAQIEAVVEFDSPIGRIEHQFKDEKSLAKLAKLNH